MDNPYLQTSIQENLSLSLCRIELFMTTTKTFDNCLGLKSGSWCAGWVDLWSTPQWRAVVWSILHTSLDRAHCSPPPSSRSKSISHKKCKTGQFSDQIHRPSSTAPAGDSRRVWAAQRRGKMCHSERSAGDRRDSRLHRLMSLIGSSSPHCTVSWYKDITAQWAKIMPCSLHTFYSHGWVNCK